MKETNRISPQQNKSINTFRTPERQSFFFKPFIQPKLSINQPNDMYEQEADAVAEKVMRMTDKDIVQTKFFKPILSSLQRKCAHCDEEKKMQRKKMNGEETTSNKGLENYVSDLNKSGQQMPKELRGFYESRMGYEFSNVKVHTDSNAAKSAQSINALAYTHGNHIVFSAGQYQPHNDSGKKLLAHELSHVMQQSNLSMGAIQRKVVDDDEHLPCRATSGRDAATLTARENEAAAMADSAAAALRVKPLPETTRELIWKRFRLDYNDGIARCYTIPTLLDRFEKIASKMRSTDVIYKCAGTGEPSSDCSNANAITSVGPFSADITLCSGFWNEIDQEKAATLLHEWCHYVFVTRGLGDDLPGGFDTADCYNGFAIEVGGGTVLGPEDQNCIPNPDPLPALNKSAIENMPCPGNVFVNIAGGLGFARGVQPGKNYLTMDLGLDYLFPLTTMHDWELSVGARLKDYKPTDPQEEEALSYGVRVGLAFRYRPWRFGYQLGIYGEGGGINTTQESGESTTQPYVAAGVTGKLNFPLSKNVSFQIFGEIAGKTGLESGDAKHFNAFETGIGIGFTVR
jgi:hypothetical protein